MNKVSDYNGTPQLGIAAVSSRFVSVKLKRETVEGMISTYEFLVWNNTSDEKNECRKILKALKKAIK